LTIQFSHASCFPLDGCMLHLLQGAEHVSAELAAVIFYLSDHRNLQ
jgi:hypothetical protein